jgi:phenylalanine-4-hydroxylase
MKDQVKDYSSTLSRPFAVNYNAYTESIDVFDSSAKMIRFANGIRSDVSRLITALERNSAI